MRTKLIGALAVLALVWGGRRLRHNPKTAWRRKRASAAAMSAAVSAPTLLRMAHGMHARLLT